MSYVHVTTPSQAFDQLFNNENGRSHAFSLAMSTVKLKTLHREFVIGNKFTYVLTSLLTYFKGLLMIPYFVIGLP